MHRLERCLRAGKVALEDVHAFSAWARGRRAGAASRFHVGKHVGEAALDRLELGEARSRSVELLHQDGDAIFKMTEGLAVAARQLQPLDFLAQAFDQGIELRRHGAAVLAANFERLGDMGDPLLQDRQRAPAGGA